jgi:hypothetical protein
MNEAQKTKPIDCSTTGEAPARKYSPIVPIACGILIMAFVALAVWPAFQQMRQPGGRVPCGDHLRRIGQAMFLYANDHVGRFPAAIADLVDQGLSPKDFVCPDSQDTVAQVGPTPQATGANIQSGGHLSYVILGQGFSYPAPRDAVLAYDPPEHHQNQGIHVLLGDGSIVWVDIRQARVILAELNSGHNPPRPEVLNPSAATRPATVPAR